MRKHLFLIFMSLLTTISASALEFTAENEDGLNIAYWVNGDGTLTVIQNAFVYSGHTSITIPQTVEYESTKYTVTGIRNGAFKHCSGLKTLKLPPSLNKEYIGDEAFKECTGLTAFAGDLASADGRCLIIDGELVAFARDGVIEYEIPNTVTSIRSYVFKGCTQLQAVTVPNTVTSVGTAAFYGCSNLSAFKGELASSDRRCLIVVNPELTARELVAFAPAELTSYKIPSSVQRIGFSAFEDCTALTSVTLPDGLVAINYDAFNGCTGLTSLTIPGNVKFIYDRAFNGCTGLTSVTVPGSVKHLGGSAFRGCTGLTSATIEAGEIDRIPMYLFQNCTNLTSVSFPEDVPEIGACALDNTGITNDPSNWEDNVLYLGKHLIKAKAGIAGEYTIKDGTILLANGAFADCDKLTGVTFPSSLTTIGYGTFQFCTGLTDVTFPSAVKFISFHAFEGCTGLQEVILPSALNQLGDYAFENCTGLRSVIFTSEPYLVGIKPFDGCPNLKKGAYIGPDNPFDGSGIIGIRYPYLYTTIKDGCILLNDDSELYYVSGHKSGEFTIPYLVRKIGENAFYGCDLLTDIVSNRYEYEAPSYEAGNFEDFYATVNLWLPSGSLLSYFKVSDWAKFENIYVGGKKVTDADDSEFAYRINPDNSEAILVGVKDPAMATAAIPEKVGSNDVTVVGKAAFKGMDSMTSLTLNSNLTTILEDAFCGCSGLKKVTIPESVSYIGDCAFTSCSSLEAFEGKYAAGTDNKCLVYDGRLISFALSPGYNYPAYIIPSSVTHICKDAFNGYKDMDALVLPYTVEQIGDRAFYDSNLKLVTLESWTFPSLDTDVFGPSQIAQLQVPEGLKDIISLNEKWNSSFTAITEFTNPLELTDATGYAIEDDSWHTSASYTRQFKSTSWQSLCLPFDMEGWDWLSYGELAELTGVTDGILEWTTVGGRTPKAEAGKPYLFRPYNAEEISFKVENTLLKKCTYLPEVSYDGYTVKGSYEEKADMAAIKGYALFNGKFYYTNDGSKTLKPFRIFLTVPSSGLAPVRICVDGEEVTGIDDILVESLEPSAADAYNLQGIRVDDSYKGIVIVNGQKIMRK